MSLARTLIRNVVSNWVGYAVQVVVAFALTPFILRTLGDTNYGIWALIMSMTGYYGLLDFGLSAGLTQYLTRYLATKDFDAFNRTASSGFVALSGCGVLVLLATLVLALSSDLLFQIPKDSAFEIAIVIAINGISVALQFVFFAFSAIFTATQRFDLSNGLGIATRILSAALTVWCLQHGYGLVGLSAAVAFTNLIDYLCRWQIARRWLVPRLQISRDLVSQESIKEVLRFGAWNFALVGSVRVMAYADSLIIAVFLPVAAIAPYAIAVNLRAYFEEVFVRVGYVFYPAAAEMDAQQDLDGLRQLYLIGSRFMFLGSILCGAIGITAAQPFCVLWLGSRFVESTAYTPVVTLFYVLIPGAMISVGQRIGYQVLLGMREVQLLTKLFFVQGVIGLVTSILLVREQGLMGVAIGNLFAAAMCQGLFQPYFVCRSLQIRLGEYWKAVLLRPLILLAVLGPLEVLVFLIAIPPSNWGELILSIMLNCVVGTTIVLVIGLNKVERERFVSRPLQLIVAKMTRILFATA